MNSGDRQRIRHIQTYCEDVAGFIERFGNDVQIFMTDRAYYNAVSMCVMQIGELANGLSDEFRAATSDEVQWGPVRGMRNWLAHAYSEMDETIIWDTAKQDVPRLLNFCKRVLEQARVE